MRDGRYQDAEETKISRYKERYEILCCMKTIINVNKDIASLQRGHRKRER